MTIEEKTEIKRLLAECLAEAEEVRKIVVFGSFVNSEAPNDLDVAVFLDQDGDYLPLAMKYRRLARPVSATIPIDIIPVRPDASGDILQEIARGEVIYER
jgi:predicted nucleotidyltransferase